LQHPATQGLGIDEQPVFGRQMFRRQRGSESLLLRPGILLGYQTQHFAMKRFRFRSIRGLSRLSVFQSYGASLLVHFPQSLPLPIAQAQDLRGMYQL